MLGNLGCPQQVWSVPGADDTALNFYTVVDLSPGWLRGQQHQMWVLDPSFP